MHAHPIRHVSIAFVEYCGRSEKAPTLLRMQAKPADGNVAALNAMESSAFPSQ